MVLASHLYKKAEEREKEVQKSFDKFVEEKYATQTSESAFSYPISENWQIAYRYSTTLLNNLTHRINEAKKSGQKLFRDQSEEEFCRKILVERKSLLQGDLRKLYDKIDEILRKRLTPSK